MNVLAKPGVYKITDKDGKVYVGSSRNIQKRLNQHVCGLRNNSHFNKRLQDAWNTHGDDFFIFSVIEYTNENIVQREQIWIDSLNALNGYNVCPKAGLSYGRLGVPLSTEHKAKIGAKSRMRRHSAETKAIISARFSGVRLSEKHAQNISKALKGRTFTDEGRARISAAKKGIPLSSATRDGHRRYLKTRSFRLNINRICGSVV